MANGFTRFIPSSSVRGQDVAHLNGAWYYVSEHDTAGCEFYYLKNVLPTHEHRLCGQI